MTKDILFIGDPWETLDHDRDSTLHLARVAKSEFAARSFWAHPWDVYLADGVLKARLAGEVADDKLAPLQAEERSRELRSFHSVHWRADPPVDIATMRLWSLIASTDPGVRFLNCPKALLTWNEKFAPLRFSQWAIASVVSNSEEVWKEFFQSPAVQGKRLLVKPSGDAASRGVQFLPRDWPGALKALLQLRSVHGPWLVIQEFEPALLQSGETRVFVLDGEICGAINKRAHPKHEIMNLDVPEEERPQLTPCDPTPEQERRALDVARVLADEGVYLATIDFIGDRILEINVTSAGLIRWLDERLPKEQSIASKYWKGLFTKQA